jgi:hypothetical protein
MMMSERSTLKRENQLRNIAEHTMLTLNKGRTLMYRLSLPYSSIFPYAFVFLSPVDVLFALFRGRVFFEGGLDEPGYAKEINCGRKISIETK